MEDLIKRLDCVRFQPFDGVVVYRDENGNEETLWDVITSAIDTIESLVSENNRLQTESKREVAKSQWIPVTERLPESSGEYLVYCGEYDGICILHYEVLKTKGKFKTKWKTVTHWMPLPDSPKEGAMNGL